MKNSIVTIALSTKFTPEQIEGVLEIVHATPNPEVAVAVLLGIYEDPELPKTPGDLSRFSEDKRDITFVSYDKYDNHVSYSYKTMKMKKGWIENGVTVDPANIANTNRYADDAARALKMELEDFKATYTYHTFDEGYEKDRDGKDRVYPGSCGHSTWIG
jgi:hypothetical protein